MRPLQSRHQEALEERREAHERAEAEAAAAATERARSEAEEHAEAYEALEREVAAEVRTVLGLPRSWWGRRRHPLKRVGTVPLDVAGLRVHDTDRLEDAQEAERARRWAAARAAFEEARRQGKSPSWYERDRWVRPSGAARREQDRVRALRRAPSPVIAAESHLWVGRAYPAPHGAGWVGVSVLGAASCYGCGEHGAVVGVEDTKPLVELQGQGGLGRLAEGALAAHARFLARPGQGECGEAWEGARVACPTWWRQQQAEATQVELTRREREPGAWDRVLANRGLRRR